MEFSPRQHPAYWRFHVVEKCDESRYNLQLWQAKVFAAWWCHWHNHKPWSRTIDDQNWHCLANVFCLDPAQCRRPSERIWKGFSCYASGLYLPIFSGQWPGWWPSHNWQKSFGLQPRQSHYGLYPWLHVGTSAHNAKATRSEIGWTFNLSFNPWIAPQNLYLIAHLKGLGEAWESWKFLLSIHETFPLPPPCAWMVALFLLFWLFRDFSKHLKDSFVWPCSATETFFVC